MGSIDQIISQSIDSTFDKLMPKEKAKFFDRLDKKYHFDFSSISQTYGTFHSILKEEYPLKHYRIESEIVKTMHMHTLDGKYKLTDEMEAFNIMAKIIQEDGRQTLQQMKNKLEAIEQTKHTIKREIASEETKFEQLDATFSEIHKDFKSNNPNQKKGE